MSSPNGKLYVVATPIGNLADFSNRAIEVLKQVDLIAAEDTRHVRMLLQHYGISNRLYAYHQHNEAKASSTLIEAMQQGKTIALVSDAGTPLLSDPGMPLVRLAKAAGIDVSPIPGACALIAALSVSGLPVRRFMFEGFLPRTSPARQALFKTKLDCRLTWVCYESSHRVLETIRDLAAVFPGDHKIVIAREMTKLYETIVKTTVLRALEMLEQDENMRRGEFVLVVDAAEPQVNPDDLTSEQRKLLSVLLKECSVKTTVAMAVEITGARKKTLYQAALRLAEDQKPKNRS